MNRIARTFASGALAALLLGTCVSSAHGQAATHRRMQDPEGAALNKLLTDAQAALDSKDFPTAAKDFQDYLAKKPDDAAAHFQLGYTYTSMLQPTQAAEEYQKAIDLNPEMAEAYLNLGLTLAESNPAAAIAPLTKAVELKPDQPEANLALGVACERTHALACSEKAYAAAAKLADDNFDAHASLARVLLAEKKPADAETEFRAALAIQPESAAAQLGLVQTLSAQNKAEAAAEEIKKYAAAHPNDPAAATAQAQILADAGKNDEALAALDAAAAMNNTPESLDTLRLRAALLSRKKDYAQLIPVIQKLVALDPKNADFPAELGHALLENKDYGNAANELIVALRANPASGDALKDLILAEYLNKNYPATLHALELIEKREPLPMGSWFVRAACFDKLNQRPEALAAYQKFLSMNKDENSDMYFEATARARTLTREIQEKKR